MGSIFDDDFMWGASVSSHQVEGNTNNDWSAWELKNARKLAENAYERLNYTPKFESIKAEAEDPNNYISTDRVDHYHKYEEDFDILVELGLNSFRFGIEWSRLEPVAGVWDQKEWEHYRKYIAALKKRKIKPVLNIWHWTNPKWFSEVGGFSKRSNLVFFVRFVKKVIEEFGKDIETYITLNEPNVYTSFSYVLGEWPPASKNYLKAFNVYNNLIEAHRLSYIIIKEKYPDAQVGLAAQLANIQAKRPHNLFDQIGTKVMRFFWNWWFLIRVKRYMDYVGINYYFTDYYKGMKRDNPTFPANDLGWYMEPEGLYHIIQRLYVRFKKPIIVTENGVADKDDEYRLWWIKETMIALERAKSEGVNVIGYFHWSLLDNFEWSYGWWPKFGLVEVDKKQKRKIKSSARQWAKWLKSDNKEQDIFDS